MTYIMNAQELEKNALKNLGKFGDKPFSEVLELAGTDRIVISVPFKANTTTTVGIQNLTTGEVSPATIYHAEDGVHEIRNADEWEQVVRDIPQYCRETPTVYVVERSFSIAI